jgi:hypothetical protein
MVAYAKSWPWKACRIGKVWIRLYIVFLVLLSAYLVYLPDSDAVLHNWGAPYVPSEQTE